MKKLYGIALGVGFLVVAVIVASVAVLKSQDFNEYKGLIAEQVKKATGRDLTIAGNLDLSVSLSPSVSVEGVSFSNAAWSNDPEMLRADNFAAEVELIPLLSGDIQVKRIVLQGVDIILETNSSGIGNWVFKAQQSPEDTETKTGSDNDSDSEVNIPVVHSMRVADVNVVYRDGVSGQEHAVTINHLDLSAADATSPLTIALAATYNEEALSVSGSLGSVAALGDDTVFPVKIDVAALGADIVIDGTIANPRTASGFNVGFDLKSSNIADVLGRALTMIGAESGSPLPANEIQVSGAARDTETGYAIDGLALKLGDSDLAGNVILNLQGARPSVKADVSSKIFSLADVQGESNNNIAKESNASAPDDGRIFPADPIAADGLKAVDADVTFSAGEVIANNLALDNIDAVLSLKNGDLNIPDFGIDFGGGRITGAAQIDASRSPLNLDVDVKGSEIDYGRILKERTGEAVLSGKLDLTLDVDGSGRSVRDLMASLNGKLRVVSKDGRIDSDALAFLSGPLASLLGDKNLNELHCAVADFDIAQGMATSKATVLETGGLSVIGSGTVNLAQETLDLYFDPRAKNASLISVADIGIHVGGTLKNPSVTPDAGDIVKDAANLAAGIATGGLSTLVESIVGGAVSATDNTDYCALALAGKPLKPDAQ